MGAFRPFMPTTRRVSSRGAGASFMAGMEVITKNFNAFCEGIANDILPDVMVDALRPTLDISNTYCPVETGELRGSGYVEARKRGRSGPTAEIGYGKNGQAPYAVFVHENPVFYHEPPTQAKFLQRAMDEDSGNIMDRIGLLTKARTGI